MTCIRFGHWARQATIVAATCAAACAIGTDRASAADPDPSRAAAVQKGIEFLKSHQDAAGAWSPAVSPAVTSLVLHAMLSNGVPAQDPSVQRAIKYLEGFRQEDGGFYKPESNHKNYETCLTIVALTDLNKDGKYDEAIKKADAFVRGLQWDEGEQKERDDPFYGGAGYGGSSRPDLSNTSFMLDALKAAGAGADDPAIQKALVFVSRTQNLESQYNTTPFAAKVNDGGFYYTPAAGGRSVAGETENGGLRSYGSMTYAGLKSMIYAGLDENDPRVKAAVDWLKKNYSVEENPQLGQTGVYYYYNTFAKALDAIGSDVFVTADGVEHSWKADLTTELVKRQKADGSWINEAERFYESDPNLATAYAILALSYTD
jgi:squalene-hopene/tetraprenyl-beta-curcumene cyclase